MADGEELPPVVATLLGEDAEFLAMLDRDIQAAREAGVAIETALTEGIGAGFTFSGGQIGNEGVGAAGEAIGGELAAGITEGAAGLGEEFSTEITPEIEAAIREMNGPVVQSMAETGAQAGAAFTSAAEEELAAWRGAVAEATAMGASVPSPVGDVFTQVDSGAISAADAVAQLEASMSASGQAAEISGAQFNAAAAALRTVGTSSGLSIEQLKAVSVSFADAQAAAERYGTSEAQLALSTKGLEEAQAALASSNATLMQSYLVMASSGQADLDGLQVALEDVASAQATVASMAQAQIDALTAVNLAVIEGSDALMNEQEALRSLGVAAQVTGVDAEELFVQLNEGTYATLNQVAADAEAQLKALALGEAQKQLAAANLTLVDTYHQVANGVEVSAQKQAAALSAAAAAQREVTALGGGAAASLGQAGTAAEGAGKSMGGLAGIMNGPLMQGIYGISAIAFLPMALGQFGTMIAGAFDNAAAAASDFTSAVQQDSNAVGDNTVVTIQNALSKSQLTGLAQQLGVSQATLIEYAAGESAAQTQVTKAYDAKAQSMAQAADASTMGVSATNAQMTAQQKQLEQLQIQKTQLDQVAAAVQQAVQQDRDFTAATMQAEQTEQIFNAALDDGHTKMLAQAQSGAMGTVATLGFSDAQSDLNHTLVEAISQYSVAANQASAYESALLALGGPNSGMVSAAQYGMLLQGALDGVTQKMQDQAQQTALSAVGALNLGDNQTGLNEAMMSGVEAFSQANTQASAYATILSALDPHTVSAAQYAMILQGALDGVTSKMQTQAQQAALSAVGVLDLGASQSKLSETLMGSVQSFSQASAQASAYATVLGSLGAHTVSAAQEAMLLGDAIDATDVKLKAQASSTALSAVAALQLGGNQGALNLALYNAVDAYAQASAQASGYGSVVTALNGSMQGMLAAEAQVTIGLDGVSKAAASNGTSLDINNAKGAQNILTFDQLSQAADKAAEAVYQNDVNTGHASQAFSDANRILGEEKQAFIEAADKAGFNKDKVKELADQLYHLPQNIPIDISANTAPATDAVQSMVEYFDHEVAYVQVYATPTGLPGGKALLPSRDAGGPVAAGEPYMIGLNGRPEVFVPGADGYITPMDMLTPAMAAPAAAGGGGFGYGGGFEPPIVNVYVTLDSQEITAASRVEVQGYARYNSLTGFVGVGN
ncbi:MAG TPA: hypothetical protein VFA06_03095 [Actinocrinis sp.]|uniref:hypothetical protein n=1 Tax=Actinocrinis sp. TaxID=1920516 RepID=UPI002D55BDAC|nr:hypothetical protein [Actinocrinis sp.]HZU54835.1 hypothetical protein [Actinocrinis sp.]